MGPSAFRLTMPLLSLLAVAACSSAPKVATDVDVTGMPNPELALRDSLHDVDGEMAKLGTLVPPRSPSPPPTSPLAQQVVPGELQKIMRFTWNGPLDDAVRQLATAIGYSVRVTAPEKPIALTVAIQTDEEPVFDIFRRLGDAAGTNATVQLDPLHHEVAVIHHV